MGGGGGITCILWTASSAIGPTQQAGDERKLEYLLPPPGVCRLNLCPPFPPPTSSHRDLDHEHGRAKHVAGVVAPKLDPLVLQDLVVVHQLDFVDASVQILLPAPAPPQNVCTRANMRQFGDFAI